MPCWYHTAGPTLTPLLTRPGSITFQELKESFRLIGLSSVSEDNLYVRFNAVSWQPGLHMNGHPHMSTIPFTATASRNAHACSPLQQFRLTRTAAVQLSLRSLSSCSCHSKSSTPVPRQMQSTLCSSGKDGGGKIHTIY